MGHVHGASSGYTQGRNANFSDIRTNAWDATPITFDNAYYDSMIGRGWNNRPIQQTNPTTNLFEAGPNIMLNADMAMGFPVGTDETVGASVVGYPGQNCGPRSVNTAYGCTNGAAGTGQNTTHPNTFTQVNNYRRNNGLFLSDFAASFVKMMAIGYSTAPSTTGKLGTLTNIDLSKC